MLWLVILLLLLWGTGWGFAVGGAFIHAILVLAVVLFLVDYFTGRRPPVV